MTNEEDQFDVDVSVSWNADDTVNFHFQNIPPNEVDNFFAWIGSAEGSETLYNGFKAALDA
jgi:hypothetical protein